MAEALAQRMKDISLRYFDAADTSGDKIMSVEECKAFAKKVSEKLTAEQMELNPVGEAEDCQKTTRDEFSKELDEHLKQVKDLEKQGLPKADVDNALAQTKVVADQMEKAADEIEKSQTTTGGSETTGGATTKDETTADGATTAADGATTGAGGGATTTAADGATTGAGGGATTTAADGATGDATTNDGATTGGATTKDETTADGATTAADGATTGSSTTGTTAATTEGTTAATTKGATPTIDSNKASANSCLDAIISPFKDTNGGDAAYKRTCESLKNATQAQKDAVCKLDLKGVAQKLKSDCTGEVKQADVFAKIENCKDVCHNNASNGSSGFNLIILGYMLMMFWK